MLFNKKIITQVNKDKDKKSNKTLSNFDSYKKNNNYYICFIIGLIFFILSIYFICYIPTHLRNYNLCLSNNCLSCQKIFYI